jgi:uncharacterized protein YkwD
MVGARARRPIAVALVATIVGLALLTSSRASAPGSSCPNPDTPSAALALPDFNYSVICLINEQRAAYAMKPLRPNQLLQDAAYIYTTSMLAGEFFTHHGGVAGKNNASTVIGRLRLLGYLPPGRRWIVGEDLREARIPTDTPAGVVQAWMNSPEHRARILKAKFEDIGVDTERGIADAFPNITGVTVAAEFGFRRFPHTHKQKK